MSTQGINDPEFLRDVTRLFRAGLDVLVLIRYAYGAGNRDFMFLESLDAFERLMKRCRARDSVIVMRSTEVLREGHVNQAFIDQSLEALPREGSWLLIGAGDVAPTPDWALAESATELREELEARIGNEVTIVEEPDWHDVAATIAAVVPDADGFVRPGAY